jgi:hypothetical protein
MPPREITELKDAIRATHGCESLHVESVPVKEVFEDQAAWEGTVEVFDLIGHLQAKRAYAWSYGTAIKTRRWLYSKSRRSIRRRAPSKSQSQAKDGQITIDKNGTSCSNALFLATTPFLNKTLPFGTTFATGAGLQKG